MSSRQRWSYKCGAHGSRVRIRERRYGGAVYIETWDGSINGYRKRSLGFAVRTESGRLVPSAVARAKREALALAHQLAQNEPIEADVTLGWLIMLFRAEKVSHLSGTYRTDTARYLTWIENFLGVDCRVATLGPPEWDGIARALAQGRVDHRGLPSNVAQPVGPQTARRILKLLRQLCLFGTRYRRRGGGFLLTVDPTRGLSLPTVADPARPVAVDKRTGALLRVADQVHEYLPALLVLARDTGRRIGAITRLRYSDWLPDVGTCGAIRWRADSDKLGRTTVVPVTSDVRDVMEQIRRDRPGVGDAYLFPAPKSAGPVKVPLCGRWLRRAEDLADLDHQHMGGWHAFRRAWATKRKDLSLKDVAAAGGWKGTQVLQSIYQQSDLDTLEEVVTHARDLRAIT